MNITKLMKTIFAGTLAFAMVATSIPADVLAMAPAAEVEATGAESPVVHWNMTKDTNGTIKDLTGNGHNGRTNGSVSFSTIDKIPVLNMTGGYVDIPDGTISDNATEVTVNMLVKISQNIPASWMWCLGSSNKRYLYFTGCCSSGQGSVMRGGLCYVPNDNGDGWNFESVINGSQPLAVNEWQNITVTFKEGEYFTFYRNGEFQQRIDVTTGKAGACSLQDLMTSDDDRDGYMGWSFYTGKDPKFQGAVADFRIYEHEMTQEEVTGLYAEVEDTLDNLKIGDFNASNITLTAEDCLGENTSADAITSNLVLTTTTTISVVDVTKEAQITKWVSSEPKVISDKGVVTRAVRDMDVTMTASVTLNNRTVDKELYFTVVGDNTDEGVVEWDAASVEIPNADDIRGNVSLPSKGELNSTITWKSSNEKVIRTTANGEILPGQVIRQEEDTEVTLTATITYGQASKTKTFDCVVKKDPGEIVTTDYLFAYFPYTSVQDERIYFGISEDGLNFDALNEGKPVIESKLGTHGLRDPFIIRSPEGDKFYLIATDLTVSGITQDGKHYAGMGWDQNQTQGSKSIMVWESNDLVNWSNQRMCRVATDDAGCTWAPEAYWDDATGQFAVFWASKVDGKQRVYQAMTRDFYTFTPAQVWIEEAGSVIDTTVIKVGDWYYRYSKNEAGGANAYGTPGKRVYCERSRSLTSTDWEFVHADSLNVGGGQIEGATIFKLNEDDVDNAKYIAALAGITLDGDDVYCLAADQTGSTVFPGLSSNIEDGWFGVLGTGSNATVNGVKLYSMPAPSASHGTIMPITSEEYCNLRKTYDKKYVAEIDKIADKELGLGNVSTVTGDLKLPATTSAGMPITWESSNEAVISTTGKVTRPAVGQKDVTVELKATFKITGEENLRDQEYTKTIIVTVKAIDVVKYTVKFISTGETVFATETVESGKAVAASKTPGRKKYSFEGWYLNGQKYDLSKPVTGNMTLTAKWKKISVGKAKLSKVKNSKKKTCVVTAKKVSKASGYQYIIATDKKFKKGVKKISTKKTSATFKKLKKGKTYYVKVRAYITDSTNEAVYGSYSASKKIKIKK